MTSCTLAGRIKWLKYAVKSHLPRRAKESEAERLARGLPDTRHEMRERLRAFLDKKFYLSPRIVNLYAFFTNMSYEVMSDIEKNRSYYSNISDEWRGFMLLYDNSMHYEYFMMLAEKFRKLFYDKIGYDLFVRASEEEVDENSIIMTFPGLADELKCSSLYNILQGTGAKVICDHRLAKIYSRTFNDLHFLPMYRHNTQISNFLSTLAMTNHYCTLPKMLLSKFMDNTTLELLKKNKKNFIIYELMALNFKTSHDLRKQGKIFGADINLQKKYSLDMHEGKRIGIIYKSLNPNPTRNITQIPQYLLQNFIRNVDALFVDLQYKGECISDNKVISPDIDKINDLEGLLALVKNLDMIVGMDTATTHLAARAGIPVILYTTGFRSLIFHDKLGWDKRVPNFFHVPCFNAEDAPQAMERIERIVKGEEPLPPKPGASDEADERPQGA